MMDQKRVVVTGATGLIGKALCRVLLQRGYEIRVFSRKPEAARAVVPGAAAYVAWQPGETGPWAAAIDGAYAVINLAGASIAGRRWTDRYKREIRDSRIIGTRGLVNAIAAAESRPRVLINPSGIDYYGDRGDTPLDENAEPGSGFLAQVCVEWEREASRAEEYGVRTVVVRNGIVLARGEGALSRLLLPFKLFVGGPILPGTQWWSWIHLADQIGITILALEDERVRGPINATAPQPQTNREFSRTLGRVLRRPALVPVPGFALRILLGEMADVLLIQSKRVLPEKARALGYEFKYPTSEEALRDILRT